MWTYFGENHGKNVCNGLFARLKSKGRADIASQKLIVSSEEGFFNYCQENLVPDKWKIYGELTDRKFHFVSNVKQIQNDGKLIYPRNEIKKFRCYTSYNGKLMRKRYACFCSAFLSGHDCEHAEVAGYWEIFRLKKPGSKKKKIDQESDDDFHQL